MIKVGDKLPSFTFLTPTADGGKKEITTDEVFAGKKVVLVGVPGAFTPTCSKNHVPGFLDRFDEIRAKGVDAVALRIRDMAREHGVAVLENPPLARALYASVEIDGHVPPEHYAAVAEVIGYVMRLSGGKTPPART